MPSASARIDLMTSPWLTASQTASGAVRGLDRGVVASDGVDGARLHRRAATRRRGRSPPTGCVCTVFQSFSLARSLSARPCHSP